MSSGQILSHFLFLTQYFTTFCCNVVQFYFHIFPNFSAVHVFVSNAAEVSPRASELIIFNS